MMVMGAMAEGESPEQVLLYTVPFWIQIHNLPTGYMAETVGRNVGNYVGEFLEYNEKNSSNFWRRYMRVRVMVDVRKPLVCRKSIKKKGAAAIMVNIKYERLGIFCYYCGMLGHAEDSCEKLYEVSEDDGVRSWGPDIRVEDNRRSRDGGSRWAGEVVSPSMQTPTKGGAAELNVALNDNQNVTVANQGAVLVGKVNRKDMMAELIKEQAKLKAVKKERIFNYAPIMGENSGVMMQATSVTAEEDEPVESDKKRLRDGRSKDTAGTNSNNTSSINPSIMQDKWDKEMIQCDETERGHETITQSSHFLSAGPGKQACREQ
jgi:hypothetical protein